MHLNHKKTVVIITDCIDIAYHEMHRTIVKELEKYSIQNFEIAPPAHVKNFSTINASFVVRLLAEIYAENTIFLVIVNDGTNKNPERIFGQTNHGIIFVGNNTGELNWMIKDFGLAWLYENKTNRSKNSKSFGGKHVGAPTVAKIIAGIPLEEIGTTVSSDIISTFSIKNGTVVHCDNFGLMKIKHPKLTETDLQEGQKVKILINGHYKIDALYTSAWKTQVDNTWVLFPGSSLDSMPELGKIRSKNSAAELGVEVGNIITWEKYK